MVAIRYATQSAWLPAPASSRRSRSLSRLLVQERVDVVGEELRVLDEEAVIRVRVDPEVGVREVVGE
jgi:hypothetical protein